MKVVRNTLRRCEVYYYHDGVFWTCCGMALRTSPTNKRDKERLKRQLKLRREEQDRIMSYKGNKEVARRSRLETILG